MANQKLIEGTVDIAAAPDVVWSLVSDLRRMGQWSPQCRKMIVFGKQVKQGTRTLNINAQGKLVWPTNAKVVTFEPNRRLAFKIVENRTVWTYDLEAIDGGTRVTESRTTPSGVSALSNFLTRRVFGGTDKFEKGLGGGINQTLERIKVAAEAK